MAEKFGHNIDIAGLTPIRPDNQAAAVYQAFQKEAKALAKEVPHFVRPTVKKHYFAATSPALIAHVYQTILSLKDDLLAPEWHLMRPSTVLSLPGWLWQQIYGLSVIRNEMALAPEHRSDPPLACGDAVPQVVQESQERW